MAWRTPPPALLALLRLAAAAAATAAVTAGSALPPAPACTAAFGKVCSSSARGDTACGICAGMHQAALRKAGCSHHDLEALCDAERPAVVVLDEAFDSFASYYQASDAGAVAFWERASGNLTLASCDIRAETSCRQRSDWSIVHLPQYYDEYFISMDVARMPDGGVLIVFIKDFPAKVLGILCADAECAAPQQIVIHSDDWDVPGDGVRVAVSASMVAVAYLFRGIYTSKHPSVCRCFWVYFMTYVFPGVGTPTASRTEPA